MFSKSIIVPGDYFQNSWLVALKISFKHGSFGTNGTVKLDEGINRTAGMLRNIYDAGQVPKFITLKAG